MTQARANLETMIDRILAANKSCEIILMVMNPPISFHLEQRPKIEDYYQMYRDVAKERKLLLVDHYVNWEPILKKDKDLFNKYVPDGIHPGDEGCTKVITPAILKRLGIRDEEKCESATGGTGRGGVSPHVPCLRRPMSCP